MSMIANLLGVSPCVKGCLRDAHHTHSGLRVAHPFAHSARGRDAIRIAVPPQVQRDYAESVAAGPQRLRSAPPRLEMYDSLHGVGGLFMPSPWVIAIGEADMWNITTAILRSHGRLFYTAAAMRFGAGLTDAQLSSFTWECATRRCMSHELGHAMDHLGATNGRRDREASADFWAGWLDARSGRTLEIGEVFFAAIGCTGRTCTHPPPAVRESQYRAGYAEGLRT